MHASVNPFSMHCPTVSSMNRHASVNPFSMRVWCVKRTHLHATKHLIQEALGESPLMLYGELSHRPGADELAKVTFHELKDQVHLKATAKARSTGATHKQSPHTGGAAVTSDGGPMHSVHATPCTACMPAGSGAAELGY